MIEVRNVTKRFPQGKSLFKRLHFVFGRGDFVFVTGPSGAGKTSLLQLVYGFSPPSEGEVVFEGENLYRAHPNRRALLRRRMGFVFQDFRLVPHLTVEANIALPLQIQHLPTEIVDKEVERVLERMGLKNIRHELPDVLSGGEKQKVAVARAVVHKPQWLLADEPTGNLDPRSSAEVLGLFREIHSSGTSVIVATHDEQLVRHGQGVCLRLEHGTIRGQYPC